MAWYICSVYIGIYKSGDIFTVCLPNNKDTGVFKLENLMEFLPLNSKYPKPSKINTFVVHIVLNWNFWEIGPFFFVSFRNWLIIIYQN